MATYTIKQGDTLSAIAKATGMSVLDVIAQNPQFANPNLIRPGEQVYISGKPSSPQQQEAAANLMLSSPLPGGMVSGGAITPAIQAAGAGGVTPYISGLVEAEQTDWLTDVEWLESLGIDLPNRRTLPRGLQETAGFEPTIPSAARNVEQIKEELSKQIGYDITGSVYKTPIGQGRQVSEEVMALGLGVRTTQQLNNALRAARDMETLKNIFLNLNAWGASIPTPLPTYSVPQNLLLTYEEAAKQRAAGELQPLIPEKQEFPGDADPYAGMEEYYAAGKEAGSYYGAGSSPVTLPKNVEGEAYLPSAFLKLSEQVQRGHRTDMEIAESLAERLMTAPHLAPISENPPENILLNTGDGPNDAFVRIQQIILAYLEQEAARYPSDIDIQTIYAQFRNAQSLEEFFAMLNYGPSDIHPNIWTRQAGLLNENIVDPDDVAASILSGQTFYDPTRNRNLFGGGGDGGGGGARKVASNSWGQAPGGLYLWRIGA